MVLSGCLSSTDPFYEASSVIENSDLIGSYTPESGDGSLLITAHSELSKRYLVRVENGESWLDLVGTLFTLDGEVYLDLTISEANLVKNSGPAGPGFAEMMAMIFKPEEHVLFGISIEKDGLKLRTNDQRSLRKFRDDILYNQNMKLLEAVRIEHDLITFTGEREEYLPVIVEGIRAGLLFQKSSTMSRE